VRQVTRLLILGARFREEQPLAGDSAGVRGRGGTGGSFGGRLSGYGRTGRTETDSVVRECGGKRNQADSNTTQPERYTGP
jgi:hypothetical protein